MEFKAIIDAKARSAAGCAVVGAYEDGDLGKAARQIDKHIGGLIGKLHKDGDFAGKLGDALLLPAPAGAAATRVLLIGLGGRAAFGRKQYRRALQAAVQALAKTGASDAVVYLALEQAGDLDVEYRARNVAEVFCAQLYRIPDLKTGAKPKTPRLASVSVAVADARASRAAAQG
ncbi:MAG: M17 family peptidase N-terminal domain-containing protein, partial [Steroidobacteraceae bacterium]